MSLSLLYQKNDGRTWPCPSFFWYDTNFLRIIIIYDVSRVIPLIWDKWYIYTTFGGPSQIVKVVYIPLISDRWYGTCQSYTTSKSWKLCIFQLWNPGYFKVWFLVMHVTRIAPHFMHFPAESHNNSSDHHWTSLLYSSYHSYEVGGLSFWAKRFFAGWGGQFFSLGQRSLITRGLITDFYLSYSDSTAWKMNVFQECAAVLIGL